MQEHIWYMQIQLKSKVLHSLNIFPQMLYIYHMEVGMERIEYN